MLRGVRSIIKERILQTLVLPLFVWILVLGGFYGKAWAQNNYQIANNNKLLMVRQLLIDGTECLHNNQNQQAKEKLEKACQIAPDLSQAHHQLGIVLAKLGENTQAIIEFSVAFKLDPSSAASLLNLAAVYQTSGSIEQAKTTYQEFIDRFPQDKDLPKIRALIASLNSADFTSKNVNISGAAVNRKQNIGVTSDTNSNLNNSESTSLDESNEKDYYADIVRRGVWLWPKDRLPIRVYIGQATANNGANTKYITILIDAFKDWAAASGGYLSFSFVNTANNADIICNWSKDRRKFENSSEAANSKVYAKNGMLDKGEIEILTVSQNDASPITDNQARTTCLHEVGHIIGLTGHSTDPQDVMYISASLKDVWIKLSNRDINTLVRLYSSNGK